MASQDKTQTTELELAAATAVRLEVHRLSGKVAGNDEALEILGTNYVSFTKEEEAAVRRKIDWRLLPLMLLVNGLQFVDKNTISYAGTYGIQKEIDLVGQQYSLLVSIFFIAYLVAEYPTNLLMQKFPTGKYLTMNFLIWGIVLSASAACKSFASLAVCRFLLGILESCINPGLILISSSWWTKEEQVFRVPFWAAANGIFSIPSGLVFYGISKLTARNMFPFQWMFLLLGITTILIGSTLWWIIPDTPAHAKFLTERERVIAIQRLQGNMTGIKNRHHKKNQVVEALTDIHVWLLVLCWFLHNLTGPLQSTFAGLIIKGFGFNTTDAILLNIPIAACYAIGMLFAGSFLITRWGHNRRIIVLLSSMIFGISGTLVVKLVPGTHAIKLLGVYLVTFTSAASCVMYMLLAANIAGYTKKVVSGALFFGSYVPRWH
ncbi:hypothetical protein SEUCBS139899_005531 [Sporothrix eucalyptigena]|uniref:Major facilitator superfamily (MFS) profile domain-containing protein n=1 Tax=Sporothrix eucalyptigena TaxID=1812306 RepID=A0ABP0D2B5_9PEZI